MKKAYTHILSDDPKNFWTSGQWVIKYMLFLDD